MTSIDDLHDDLENVSETVLGSLDARDRLRLFIEEAAADNGERVALLAKTAPEYEYRAPDLAYTQGVREVMATSLTARLDLQHALSAVRECERTRDLNVALLLLNEVLGRLSRDAFAIDEEGRITAPPHGEADYAYGEKYPPDTVLAATKYHDVWRSVPAELLLDALDHDRTRPYWPGLGARGAAAADGGSTPDHGGGEAGGLDGVVSAVGRAELELVVALTDLYTAFHGWRRVAEDHLGVSLDELLGVTGPHHADLDNRAYSPSVLVDEVQCEAALALKQEYLDALPDLAAVVHEGGDTDPGVDLDVRAQAFADRVADELGYIDAG